MKYYITIFMIFISTIGLTSCKKEDTTKENATSEVVAFQDYLSNWEKDDNFAEIMENCDSAEYGYYDIDSDGIKELIIKNTRGVAIFKYEDEQIKRINWSPYSTLLENGMIKYYRPGAAPQNEKYKYYSFNGSEYVEIENIERYDKDEDGDYDSSDWYISAGEEVSFEQWTELYEKYEGYKEAVLSDTGEIFVKK